MKKLERELNEIWKHMDNVFYLMGYVTGNAEMKETEQGEIVLDDYSEEQLDMLQELCDYLYIKLKEVEGKLEEKAIIKKKKSDLYAQLGQLVFINAKYDEEDEAIADIEEELLDLIETETEMEKEEQ